VAVIAIVVVAPIMVAVMVMAVRTAVARGVSMIVMRRNDAAAER
jgi:hypothetical protein